MSDLTEIRICHRLNIGRQPAPALWGVHPSRDVPQIMFSNSVTAPLSQKSYSRHILMEEWAETGRNTGAGSQSRSAFQLAHASIHPMISSAHAPGAVPSTLWSAPRMILEL